MKYNQTTLDKLEQLVEESGYVLRYERGTFQSGYCILEQKKVVVLNKFLQTEGRINTLIDLIPQLEINHEILTEESKKLHDEVNIQNIEQGTRDRISNKEQGMANDKVVGDNIL
jgi:hypothetical protein